MTNFIVISIIATMIGIWLSITLLSAIKFSVLEREEMHKKLSTSENDSRRK